MDAVTDIQNKTIGQPAIDQIIPPKREAQSLAFAPGEWTKDIQWPLIRL
jgi:hypothetical protein